MMYVYSGKCRLCECGLTTKLTDDMENKLKTGDIVMSYIINQFGVSSFDGLTVVVADQWQTYNNDTHVLNKGKIESFVMGIKDVELNLETGIYPDSTWRVRRLKKFEDVIDGEHWANFVFSYREETP